MQRASAPVGLSSFIGRSREVARLTRALADHRLVTVAGAGGGGKSRLAQQIAVRSADAFPDGVCWVDLSLVTEPDLVPGAVAAALGLPDRDGQAATTDRLAGRLGDRRFLLVLDGCERVARPVAVLAQTILASCPRVTTLATSRVRLGLPGELVWPVPPMPPDEAAELFAARAREGGRVDLATRPGVSGAVAEICRRLDGLPLAIELAAARTRSLSVEQIAAELDNSLRLLGGGNVAVPRHQTMRACIDWSHNLLDPAARTLLRRLSVFAGDARLDAVEAVCGFGDLPPADIIDVIGALADQSLLAVVEHAGQARYRLSDTVTEYARERLVEAGEQDELLARHGAVYLEVVDAARSGLARGWPAGLDALDADLANLTAALATSVAAGRARDLLRPSTTLGMYWLRRCRVTEGLFWLRNILDHSPAEPSAERADALLTLANLLFYVGDFETAAGLGDAAAAMAAVAGDPGLRAVCLLPRACIEMFADPVRGRGLVREALDLVDGSGDAPEATVLLGAVFAHLAVDDHDRVGPLLARLDHLCDRLGPWYQAYQRAAAASGAAHRGEYAAALSAAEWILAGDHGDATTYWYADDVLATVDAARGRWDRALERLTARAAHLGRQGAKLSATYIRARVAALRTAAGDAAAADAELTSILTPFLAGQAGIPPALAAYYLLLRARARLVVGDPAAAADIDRARGLAAPTGNSWQLATADYLTGRRLRRDGELAQAAEHHHRALAARARQRIRPEIADSLEALAGLAAARGQDARAVALFGAADGLRGRIGCVRAAVDEDGHDAELATLRARLEPAAFAAAWAEGADLDLDAAVRLAGRARGRRGRPAAGWESLTPTEREVASLVAAGLTNPEIARKLTVALGTVKAHLARIFSKLAINNRAELATITATHGSGAPVS